MDKISVVVPCYNEAENIELFYNTMEEINEEYEKATFEYIFVNDGSKDNSLEILRKLRTKDEKVRYISFARNFGKEAGILAGLKAATGDYTVVIDADLQHSPELIVKMHQILITSDYDSVVANRSIRKEKSFLKRVMLNGFYKTFRKFTKLNIYDNEMDFRMMTRQMLDAVLQLTEYNRFTKGIFNYVGFNTININQKEIKRQKGETKFGFKALFKYSIEAFTSFTGMPLLISFIVGLVFIFIALISFIFIILKSIFTSYILTSPAIILPTIFMISGINLVFLGLVGIYIYKIYLEVKNRPLYIIKETEKDYDKKNIKNI